LLSNRYSNCRAHDTFSEKRKQRLIDDAVPALGVSVAPTDQVWVDMITLDQLIDEFGLPDYVKIDVEGFELEVIRGLSQPVKMLTFECSLPDFLEESVACVNSLYRLSPNYRYNFWCEDHSFALKSKIWLSKHEIVNLLGSGTYTFLEVVAVLPALPDH
jgi:hypothetical protein